MPKKIKPTSDIKIKKRAEAERQLTIIIIFVIVIFVVAWTPYAMVAMYSAFINPKGVSPLLGTIPAIFAKSSMLWTSVIYIFSNRQIRENLTSLFKFCKPKSPSESKIKNEKFLN